MRDTGHCLQTPSPTKKTEKQPSAAIRLEHLGGALEYSLYERKGWRDARWSDKEGEKTPGINCPSLNLEKFSLYVGKKNEHSAPTMYTETMDTQHFGC